MVITGAIEDAAARRVIAGEVQACVAGWCTSSPARNIGLSARIPEEGDGRPRRLEAAQVRVQQLLADEESHDRPEGEEGAERNGHLARGQAVARE